MTYLGRFMDATAAAYRTFVGTMAQTSASVARSGDDATWDTYDARCLRYAIFRAFYDGTAYDPSHPWSASYKLAHRTPKHIRGLYNPCYRLGRFYIARLFGGDLDEAAGDGKGKDGGTAIPIETTNEAVRPAIARLWKDSRWSVNKDVFSAHVAIEGSAGLKVVADPVRGHMRLEVVPPSELAWVEFDDLRNVKGYEIRRVLPDPRLPIPPVTSEERTRPRKTVVYREVCTKRGEAITFTTLLDNRPYPWNGAEATWTTPLGFVPMTVAHFEDIGLDWGANCFFSGMAKFRDADGLAASLTDQVHKAIRNPILVSGENVQATDLQFDDDKDAVNIAFIGRADVKATAMTFDLDVADARGHISDLVANFERDYAELRTDPGAMMGTPTAEAVRAARSESTTTVKARRIGPDDALARGQIMALGVGGMLGFEGYEAFGLDSYARGLSLHRIGDRPVFAEDPAEKVANENARSIIILNLTKAGMPIGPACELAGVPKDMVAKIVAAKATADAEAEAKAARDRQTEQAANFQDDGGDGE